MPSYRIAFRSDTRPPSTIFVAGFSPHFLGPIEYNARPNCAGDINNRFSVTVSTRFNALVLFPMDMRVATSYIYMVAIDVERMPHELSPSISTFNTHARQVLDVNHLPEDIYPTQAYWSVFSDELTVKEIHPLEVIAAVQVQRLGRPLCARR